MTAAEMRRAAELLRKYAPARKYVEASTLAGALDSLAEQPNHEKLIAEIDEELMIWGDQTVICDILTRCRAALESKPDIFPRSDWSDKP